jgi:hypothetical protein
MVLGGPAKSSRRKALCRAARLKGAPFGPGKGVETGPIGEISGRAAVDPVEPGALSRHAKSARRQRSMVPRSPCPTEALLGPQF